MGDDISRRGDSLSWVLLLACLTLALIVAPGPVSAQGDNDGIDDSDDNCSDVANGYLDDDFLPPLAPKFQLDSDWDGFGNACDGDFNNDGLVDDTDFGLLLACCCGGVPRNGPPDSPSCTEMDMDGDGLVFGLDFSMFFVSLALGEPGPGAIGVVGRECTDEPLSGVARCYGASGQGPDFSYLPTLAPTYDPTTAPIVGVASSHGNTNTSVADVGDPISRSDGYTGFARLLRADGYVVRDTSEAFEATDPDCAINLLDEGNCSYFEELRSIDTLVIANPKEDYSADEVALITGWLSGDLGCSGGCASRRLVLIADHDPIPSHIQEFALVFGLTWPVGTVSERTFSTDPPGDPDTTGILDANHPIIVGSGPNQAVSSVTAFAGSAFRRPVPEGSEVSLLTLPPGATITGSEPVSEAGGYSQGMIFTFGTGRVYVGGESAGLTAQAKRYNPITEPEPTPGRIFGMQSLPYNQNQRFLLNLMHWLDGA